MDSFQRGRLEGYIFGQYCIAILIVYGLTRLVHRVLKSKVKYEIRSLIGFGIIFLIGIVLPEDKRGVQDPFFVWVPSGLFVLICDFLVMRKREPS